MRRLVPLWASALALTATVISARDRAPDLVEIVRLDPTIKLDVRYATSNNFIGTPVYDQARAFLQRPAAEALVSAHKRLARKGYGIVVHDGYRPWRVTKLFWDRTPGDKKVFVADPREGSKHNRGCAIDLSLYDLKTGAIVAMPGDYDEMSERSYATYAGGTSEQRERRDLLRSAMEAEGFSVYPYEWWHFDYKDWREYPILDVPFSAIVLSAPVRPPLDLAAARTVDLTHAFDETTLYWPNASKTFALHRDHFGKMPAGFFYAANSFEAPEHGGTHLDAPIHFAEGRQTADRVPLDRLILPAIVIDVRDKTALDRDYRLTTADVLAWEKVHGRIPSGCAVLLHTGWGRRWPDRKATFGDDVSGRTTDLHFPAFGPGAAELLVRERGIAALGLDTPSLDHGPSSDFPVHRIAAEANLPGFENLANLEALPPSGSWLVALPMKIGGGSGAPLRAVALLP